MVAERSLDVPVPQIVEVPVPKITDEIADVLTLMQQEHFQHRIVEKIVRVLVPRVQEEIVEVIKMILLERASEHTVEQIADIPLPETVETIQSALQERIQERIEEEFFDVPPSACDDKKTTETVDSIPQERDHNRTAEETDVMKLVSQEQIVAVPVPQIQVRAVEVFSVIPQERVQQHISCQRQLAAQTEQKTVEGPKKAQFTNKVADIVANGHDGS